MIDNTKTSIYDLIAEESEKLTDPRKIMNHVLADVKKTISLDENYPTIEDKRKALGGTKVHAISVQKGGVGKTTISSNLAWTLSNLGFKVLLIDSDPQGSLTELCNIHANPKIPGLQDIYMNMFENHSEPSWDVIKSVIVQPKYVRAVQEGMKWVKKAVDFGFDFIPANITLSDLDILLPNDRQGGLYMLTMMEEIKENADYDYIIIDCMPGLGTLTCNAIAASTDGIIVPVNLEMMTIVGARNLVDITRDIQNQLRRISEHSSRNIVHKGILGIVKNQYNSRRKVTRKYEDILHAFFPIVCFSDSTDIPNKAMCDTAHDMGRFYADMDKAVGKVFEELSKEVIALDIYRRPEARTILVPNVPEDFEAELDEMQRRSAEENNEEVEGK